MTEGERQAVEMLDSLAPPWPRAQAAVAALLGAVIGGCLPLLDQEKRLRVVRYFDAQCQRGPVGISELIGEIRMICKEQPPEGRAR